MPALTTTTLNGAVSTAAPAVLLTSATGVSAGSILFADREAMRVISLVGTRCKVERGWGGTTASGHLSGETVYIGAADQFYQADPLGTSLVTDPMVTPWINLKTGDIFQVQGGEWVRNPLPVVEGGTGATTLAGAAVPLAAYAAYPKTSTGVLTHLAAASAARNVLLVITVTEVFAAGTGAEPTFKIGETDTDDKFAATSVFTSAAVGTTFTRTGSLTAGKALIVTATAATGTATGALGINVFTMPAA